MFGASERQHFLWVTHFNTIFQGFHLVLKFDLLKCWTWILCFYWLADKSIGSEFDVGEWNQMGQWLPLWSLEQGMIWSLHAYTAFTLVSTSLFLESICLQGYTCTKQLSNSYGAGFPTCERRCLDMVAKKHKANLKSRGVLTIGTFK